MEDLIERLSKMNIDQIDEVIEKDMEEEGEISFELEGILLSIVHAEVFPGSETFGDLDEESPAEKCIRRLIESLGIPETLGAILALDGPEEADDDEDDSQPEVKPAAGAGM